MLAVHGSVCGITRRILLVDSFDTAETETGDTDDAVKRLLILLALLGWMSRKPLLALLKRCYESGCAFFEALTGSPLIMAVLGGLAFFWVVRKGIFWVANAFARRKTNGFDSPIEEACEDRLGRNGYVESLRTLIRNADGADSQVIGIYGEWGEGKTSAVKLLESSCRQHKDKWVRFVWFDPWHSVERKDLNSELFMAIGSRLFWIGNPVLAFSFLQYACQRTIQWMPDVHGLGQLVAVIFAELCNLFSSLDAVKEELKDRLVRSGRRIVVVLDDLDRLGPNETSSVIDCLKTNGDLPFVTYLVLSDENRLARLVGAKYELKNEDGKGAEIGHEFLEKVVNHPMPLWPVHAEVRKTELRRLIDQCLLRYGRSSTEIVDDDLDFCLREFPNLRRLKRLVASFESTLSYYRASAGDDQSLDVHLGDVLRLVALRLVDSRFADYLYGFYYKWIRTGFGLMYNGYPIPKDRYEELLNQADSGIRSWVEDFLKDTMMIVPSQKDGQDFYEPVGIRDSAAWQAYRMASPAHFGRYFHALELPENAIPKDVLLKFFSVADDDQKLKALLQDAHDKYRLFRYVEKLIGLHSVETSLGFRAMIRAFRLVVEMAPELEPLDEVKRARLVDRMQEFLCQQSLALRKKGALSETEEMQAVEDIIASQDFVSALALLRQGAYLVDPEVKVDAMKLGLNAAIRLWEWIKSTLVGKIFESDWEGRADFEFIAMNYNRLVFTNCAVDCAIFMEHVDYAVGKMMFPDFARRLKTFGTYAYAANPNEDRLVFSGYSVADYRIGFLRLLEAAEKVLVDHFDSVPQADRDIVRKAGVNIQTKYANELLQLFRARG